MFQSHNVCNIMSKFSIVHLNHFKLRFLQLCTFSLFQGGDPHVETLNDAADFNHVKKALSVIEFSAEEQNALFAIIASVLHLGTVGFLKPEVEHGEVRLENGRPVNIISKVHYIFKLLL